MIAGGDFNEIKRAGDDEEDEGIDDDDEEKGLVDIEQINDDDTLETTTNTNTNTENTTTTIINDSDATNPWKGERWHQECNDDTSSKRSSNTSIISHHSISNCGAGAGSARVLVVSQNDIIIEINGGQHESNEENSDIELEN